MSFGPQVVIPGAFHFEASSNDGASLSGVHPGIFRQPVSPSPSTSVYLGRSTGSLYSDISTPAPNVKRKRQGARESTPLNEWTMAGDSGFSMSNTAERKPDLGARKISGGRRRYILAGQINTPNGETQKELGDAMQDSVYSDADYRRALGSKPPHPEPGTPLSKTSTDSMFQGQNIRCPGWSTFAMKTLGGVVGKVWEFCKAGAFRGFYAGGGKGYAIQQPPSDQTSKPVGQVWCNEHDVPTLPSYPASAGLPESDYSPYHYEPEAPEATTPPPPAAKRRQIDEGTTRDELRKNWVVINEPVSKNHPSAFVSRAPSSAFTPRRVSGTVPRRIDRPIHRLDPPRFGRHRPSRASYAGATSAPRQPASYASPRPSSVVAPAYRSPSRIPVPASGNSSTNSRPQTPVSSAYGAPSRIPSPSPSPTKAPSQAHGSSSNNRRRTPGGASAASVASASAAPSRLMSSPSAGRKQRGDPAALEIDEISPRLDREAKKLAARRLQAERETDLRINDFNVRLREMIRQGREALGTSVEVDLVDGEDGDLWEDD
ncbi:hypothetical protein DL766_007519 [Monosporascus sp. MC13-8B]|uniref:WH2 domain-containing protein n=1 Tax=Monosporascus cannonballus TaxID=155416 RepID=A0ABY0HG35_9PEZI|nr:hypothetical protein DL762_002431 [Monosporascus cannonballus]RYP00186.1 hypothetical protein DL763_000955 [Monosporascus cannonballus]RYP23451.1 hypothetical protein DL766_007519 [Monosporascus sp. MC13-8B]